jgi:hypothetical protein
MSQRNTLALIPCYVASTIRNYTSESAVIPAVDEVVAARTTAQVTDMTVAFQAVKKNGDLQEAYGDTSNQHG